MGKRHIYGPCKEDLFKNAKMINFKGLIIVLAYNQIFEKKQINNSINFFRLICAFLVVAIHAHPFTDINKTLGFISTEVLTRVAVPFFFIVSGYFYYKKLNVSEKVEKAFITYIRKLLITYCIWSCIYFSVNAYLMLINGLFDLKSYIVDCALRFLFIGPYYHLWYIPALFISICLMTFFKKIKHINVFYLITIILYVIGVIGCAYSKIGLLIPILRDFYSLPFYDNIRKTFLMGLPFFAAGYMVHILCDRIKKVVLGVVLFGIFTFAEIAFVICMKWENGFVTTFALYPFVIFILLYLLKHPYSIIQKSSDSYRKISGFVYYAHPLVIFVLTRLFSLSETPMFIFTCLICTVLGIMIVKINNKYLMKLL